MLSQFQVYNKVNQLLHIYICVCAHFQIFFLYRPLQSSEQSSCAIQQILISLSVIHFKYSSVFMSNPISQFILNKKVNLKQFKCLGSRKGLGGQVCANTRFVFLYRRHTWLKTQNYTKSSSLFKNKISNKMCLQIGGKKETEKWMIL